MVDRFRRLALAGSFSTIAYSRPAPFETLRSVYQFSRPFEGVKHSGAVLSSGPAASCRHLSKNLTWHVVPDLVVEIIRSSEQTEQVSAWLDQYFHAGVNRVWVVYPDQLKIHDHDSLSSSRVLDRNQSLDGGSILPGFPIPVKALVADGND